MVGDVKVYKRLQSFVSESNYFRTEFNCFVVLCLQCRKKQVDIISLTFPEIYAGAKN